MLIAGGGTGPLAGPNRPPAPKPKVRTLLGKPMPSLKFGKGNTMTWAAQAAANTAARQKAAAPSAAPKSVFAKPLLPEEIAEFQTQRNTANLLYRTELAGLNRQTGEAEADYRAKMKDQLWGDFGTNTNESMMQASMGQGADVSVADLLRARNQTTARGAIATERQRMLQQLAQRRQEALNAQQSTIAQANAAQKAAGARIDRLLSPLKSQ